MAEELTIDPAATKAEKFRALLPQIEALVGPEPDLVANLANVSAALHSTFGYLWVGFYFVRGDELVLGPFQGPVACTRFPVSKGVCGAAVRGKETIIVPDVDAFPGHIACSSLSRSEIVVPLMDGKGEVRLVLDVDSAELDDFDTKDRQFLVQIVEMLRTKHFTE